MYMDNIMIFAKKVKVLDTLIKNIKYTARI